MLDEKDRLLSSVRLASLLTSIGERLQVSG